MRLLGFEPTGAETIVICLAANAIANLEAALETAKRVAASPGLNAITSSIASPKEALFHLNDYPNTMNALYGGRDELRPMRHPFPQR